MVLGKGAQTHLYDSGRERRQWEAALLLTVVINAGSTDETGALNDLARALRVTFLLKLGAFV